MASIGKTLLVWAGFICCLAWGAAVAILAYEQIRLDAMITGKTGFIARAEGIESQTFVMAQNAKTITKNIADATQNWNEETKSTYGKFGVYDGMTTLVAGSSTVTVGSGIPCTPGATCNYRFTNCGAGGTPGFLSFGGSNSTQFIVASSSNTDTSKVCWLLRVGYKGVAHVERNTRPYRKSFPGSQ